MATDATGKRSRAGRRPGSPDTRASIIEAARKEFAAKGFDKTSMRGVAKLAEVDPALVHHYFDSKDGLFLASMALPFDPRTLIPELTADGTGGMGIEIATRFLDVWESPQSRLPIETLLRSATTSEAAANALRNGLVRMIFGPLSAALDAPDAVLRAQFVASQLVGMAMARYVLKLEPLASTPRELVAARLAPTLQGYLDGADPLGP